MYTKYLIIGGGITGLSFAANLQENDYYIIEKEDNVGGYCRTIRKEGFVWDYAGHFFHFQHEDVKNKFADLLESNKVIHNKKNTKIYYKGKYIEYPFQYNIHQLPYSEFLDCLVDLFECKREDKAKNFEDMLYKKYGKSIADKFLIPYNKKLYACDLNFLDVEAMGRFFPMAEPEEIVRGFRKEQKETYNKEFLYPKDGAATFVDVIYQRLNKKRIMTDTKALKIDYNQKKVYTTKGTFEYEYLINTIPLNIFLEKAEVEHSIEFQSNKVLVFNIGFNLPSSDNSFHWVYYPDNEICFYRVGFYNNILHEDRMSIYVELGFKENEEINVEMWKEKVLYDLKKVGVITNQQVVASNHIIMKPAYVHINKNCQEKIDVIMKELNNKNIYSIGRYGSWTYCSIEDCIVQANNLSKCIVDNKMRGNE